MQIFHVFYRFSVDYSDNGYIMKHIRYEKTGYDTLNQKPITDKQKLIELFEALDIPYQLNGDGLVAASRLYWFNAAGEVERVTDLLTGESWEGEE